jgi:RNA polymerase sigma factor (sigma-70 family)
MAEVTLSSMHDARDAEDTRLIEEGTFTELLAGYFHPVRERCFVKLRNRDAGDEAAQRVFLRLLKELQGGKRYGVPFRVVVWMVVEWTVKGLYPAAKVDATLPDSWDGASRDAFAEWEADHDLGLLFADLPPRQREVLQAIYREGLDAQQTAEKLGIAPNAVYQALHNGHRNLAERLGA